MPVVDRGQGILVVLLCMGAPQTIFTLFRIPEGSAARLVVVKAIRPEFPNWIQTAEDASFYSVQRQLHAIIAKEAGSNVGKAAELIATWESGLPNGDCFYEAESGIDLAIWYAMDTVHPGYFVFGVHPDELSFWSYIEELSQDGDIGAITHYARPAKCAEARFVQ